MYSICFHLLLLPVLYYNSVHGSITNLYIWNILPEQAEKMQFRELIFIK